MPETQLLTVLKDENGGTEQFFSPSIEDAARGVASILLSAFITTGLEPPEGGVKPPEDFTLRVYKVQTEGGKILEDTVQKLLKSSFEFFPDRFEGILRNSPDIPQNNTEENLVKIS